MSNLKLITIQLIMNDRLTETVCIIVELIILFVREEFTKFEAKRSMEAKKTSMSKQTSGPFIIFTTARI
jgi:hypothetical protein